MKRLGGMGLRQWGGGNHLKRIKQNMRGTQKNKAAHRHQLSSTNSTRDCEPQVKHQKAGGREQVKIDDTTAQAARAKPAKKDRMARKKGGPVKRG